MENNESKKEITLMFLIRLLRKGLLWMVIAAVAVGMLAAAYAHFLVKPTYTGEITLWANDGMLEFVYKTEDASGEESSSVRQWIKEAPYVATFSVEMVKEKVLAEKAVTEHDLVEKLGYESKEQCIDDVIAMLSASKDDPESYAFTLRATASSREAVYHVLLAVQDVMPDVVSQMTGLIPGTGSELMKPSTTIESMDDIRSTKLSSVKAFVLGAFVAAVLAYLIVFIKTMLDTKVYGEKNIKDNFEQPVIGVIPTWASTDPEADKKKKGIFSNVKNRNYKGRLLNAETPFAITEAFNSFRTNVIFSTSNCKGPVIAVTSSVSAEGKSLVCANLATSLSLLDKRVLLVECDMRCPSLTKIFDKEVETGLSELLAGITDNTDSVINHTSNENLDIVYCGKIPPNPSELLSSSVMKALVEKWKAEYDYVIMDLPPVCEVSDAGVIAELANGYVIAVRSNYSDLNEVRSCVSSIRSVDGAIMGFVVNDVNLKSGASYSSDYRRTYRHRSYYYRRNEN